MRLVIDANILFSSLIKDGKTAEIALNNNIQLFCPEFLFEEFLKYRDYILTKTHLSIDDFNKFYSILIKKISVVPSKKILPFFNQAKKISPDPKDTVYLALAISIHVNLWSNDKKLKINQSSVEVFSTSDLVHEFKIDFDHNDK